MNRSFAAVAVACALALTGRAPLVAAPAPALDERPAVEGEWGFRPVDGGASPLNPPRFSWRPQEAAASYQVQASRDATFGKVEYEAANVPFNVLAPERVFPGGEWAWRFRSVDKTGNTSAWSTVRRVTVTDGAVKFPFPKRAELLSRVPASHPRLFVRPEQMDDLRRQAKGELKPLFDVMLTRAEKLLKAPVPTEEPPKYPDGTVRLSEEWRGYWNGAQRATQRTLEPAALLGFAYQLSGDARFADEAKRLLMAAAKWEPFGASGYLYNDEAGMPYNYLFSRTYTFINDRLSEAEKRECRALMRKRGTEMYRHLCPTHFWTPYNSHKNRAWHFLGEIAVAFHGEIPEADDWLYFSTSVFANVYPVWNDSDGGWHEGVAYWRSYLNRFSWWADIQHAAVGIDAYRLPFFSKVGDYAMYMQPPGSIGGFGDQANKFGSTANVGLLETFAAQAGNPYWKWYADAHGERQPAGDYVEFVRAARPKVEAKAPTDLPTSAAFRGIGQAYLNTTLLAAKDDVQVQFKSSPMGTQSHGYDANNAFLLSAFGERLLVSSGERDIYGSDHHKDWMWETKSTNSVTVSGRGQIKHSPKGKGQVTRFEASPRVDVVEGEAGAAYEPALKQFTRTVVFLKPSGLTIVYDRLAANSPETYEYRLHSPVPFEVEGKDVRLAGKDGSASVTFLAPANLAITTTDKFDVPPRPVVKLQQYHLTAATERSGGPVRFVTVLRPHRTGETVPPVPAMEQTEAGYVLKCQTPGGVATVTLPFAGDVSVQLPGTTASAAK
jgi:hypothetical protein